MYYNFRSDEERAAIVERAAANRAWMDTVYAKPKPAPQPPLLSIHRAIIAGDLAAVRANLTPTTVNLATVSGLTPLHLACFGYAQVVDTPTWHRANLAGTKTRQEAIVDLLLEEGAQLDVWDQARRIPAACCEGKKQPASLVAAMAKMIQDTAHRVDWMKNSPESQMATLLNAFFAKGDISVDKQQGRA